MAIDDIMIVVPRVFSGVLPVLVVKRQQCLDVVAGIFLSKGFCSLLDTIVTPVQQTIGNGRVDNLPALPLSGVACSRWMFTLHVGGILSLDRATVLLTATVSKVMVSLSLLQAQSSRTKKQE